MWLIKKSVSFVTGFLTNSESKGHKTCEKLTNSSTTFWSTVPLLWKLQVSIFSAAHHLTKEFVRDQKANKANHQSLFSLVKKDKGYEMALFGKLKEQHENLFWITDFGMNKNNILCIFIQSVSRSLSVCIRDFICCWLLCRQTTSWSAVKTNSSLKITVISWL